MTSRIAEMMRVTVSPVKAYTKHATNTLVKNNHQNRRRCLIIGALRGTFTASAYANGASRAANPASKKKEVAGPNGLVAARATHTIKMTQLPIRASGNRAVCHSSEREPGTRFFMIASGVQLLLVEQEASWEWVVHLVGLVPRCHLGSVDH